MNIISHRGYWKHKSEKNTIKAFERSVSEGFGIETDVRDCCGQLVVSHDIPKKSDDLIPFNSLLEMFELRTNRNAVMAINVKSDGITDLLAQAIKTYGLEKYFTFDMSIPSLYFSYQPSSLRFFSTVNEFVKKPILFERCNGIWMDAYSKIWFNIEDIFDYLKQGKDVCLVSPELHNREFLPLWKLIRDSKLFLHEGFSICTDLPAEAREYFV
ncbi:MAG: hypothetical protein WC716_13720 [Chitinophagaceae bacterium]|jgi:hypothetical protein